MIETVRYLVSYQDGKVRWHNEKDTVYEARAEAERLAGLGCEGIRVELETTTRKDITEAALKAQQA